MRRTDTLSPRGSALVAAASAVASFAPFGPGKYEASTARADGGASHSDGGTNGAPNIGEPSSQPPYGNTGWSHLRRRFSDVEVLKRLVDLLSHLDCFWLAQDLCSGDSARVQSSFRVVSTMALLLLVLWLAVVPSSADKPWRASSVGLLLIASLTMNLVAAPMASLLPFLCMPLLDLADTRAAALPYSTVRQMSFLCAMLLMLTMEECGLSTRLALLILSHTGHKINSILALVIGVAVAMTCLLDAFSVTVLMMSTVECIVDEIYFHIIQANLSTDVYDANRHRCPGSPVTTGSMQPHRTGDSTEHVSYFAYRRNLFNEYGTYVLDERNTLFKAMMAAVVYGSNIGSGGTSRGSQQGYYLLHFLRQTYKEATTLNYFTWTAYSAPSVVASAVFLWWHLCNRWVPRGFQVPAQTSSQTNVYHVKYEEMKKLG
ncbi:Na(+)/citrate cotransporter-like [Amblyomma americanum]